MMDTLDPPDECSDARLNTGALSEEPGLKRLCKTRPFLYAAGPNGY